MQLVTGKNPKSSGCLRWRILSFPEYVLSDLFIAVFNEHSLAQMLLASLVIFFATAVQVGMGIAFGLIAGPLLALIDVAFVPVPVLFLTFATSISAFWGERKGVQWKELQYAVSGRVIGSIAGAMVLAVIPGEKVFMLIFGSLIALAVLVSISGFTIPFTLKTVGIAGTVSGFTAAITSVGGPPMAVVYQNQKAAYARPTLQTYFAMGSFATLCILAIAGQVELRDAMLAALLLPALALGVFIGPRLRPFLDKSFRPFLLGSAAIAAAMLIVKGLA